MNQIITAELLPVTISTTDIIAEVVLLDMDPWATSYLLKSYDVQPLLDQLGYRVCTPAEALGYMVVGHHVDGMWLDGFKIYDIV